MMTCAGRGSASALLIALALHGAGAETPVRIPPESWNVHWGDLRCSLVRRSEAAGTSFFALETLPGSRQWAVRVTGPIWPDGALDDPSRLGVTFHPGGAAVTGRAVVEPADASPTLTYHGVPESLLDSFAAAESVRVARGDRLLLEIAVPGSARAVTAVRDCEASAMREWGIDPTARPAVPAVPRRNLASLVLPSDYPRDALTGGHGGTVVVRLSVDASGRVRECAPVASSGHAGLDRQSCAVARRARYEPARAADGTPVAAATIASLTWAVGGRRR